MPLKNLARSLPCHKLHGKWRSLTFREDSSRVEEGRNPSPQQIKEQSKQQLRGPKSATAEISSRHDPTLGNASGADPRSLLDSATAVRPRSPIATSPSRDGRGGGMVSRSPGISPKSRMSSSIWGGGISGRRASRYGEKIVVFIGCCAWYEVLTLLGVRY